MNQNGLDLSIPKGAIFSEDRKYRYVLWRVWRNNPSLRLFIGLNPSTANEIIDDPTITRSIKRANKDGFGGLLMMNLYAFVSTNPNALLEDGDFIGINNNAYLEQMIELANQTVCGWGSFAPVKNRAPSVLKMIPEPYCLGINKDGQPKHPLYISYDTPIVKYDSRAVGK